jgi:selenocysteine lyase/cysteine desulfurase
MTMDRGESLAAVGAGAGSAVVYLNNAATAWPKAPGVAEAVKAALEESPAAAGRANGDDAGALDACRAAIAGLLGVRDPSRIVLAAGGTEALNLAILGAGVTGEDLVVTTAAEHNSVLRPLERLRRVGGVRLEIAPLDGEGGIDMAAFEEACGRGPRLVALCHSSNVTGRVFEVEELFAIAKAAGAVTLLDACQSLGHVGTDYGSCGADLIAFTGHKGLMGPPGTGGLAVIGDVEVEQVLVGGTGVRSDLLEHPPELPIRLESGTPNVPAFAGLRAALEWAEKEGPAHRRAADAMRGRLVEGLGATPGVRLYGACGRLTATPIVSFGLEGWSAEEAGYALATSFGVACRTGLHCAPLIHGAIGSAPGGTVRFSPSGFTTPEEVDEALGAVRRLVGQA